MGIQVARLIISGTGMGHLHSESLVMGSSIRNMCGFFRYARYRQHIESALDDSTYCLRRRLKRLPRFYSRQMN